ncbi:MAG: polysaccharide export protein [Cohaesibacter sp.]|nr:polysaccharide export protein [Cohaesibacter sp.]
MIIFNFFKKAVLATTISFAFVGCAMLPRSGPDDGAIARQAASTLSNEDLQALKTKYALLDINDAMLPYFQDTLLTSFAPGFKGARQRPPVLPVGIGDKVKITIFESAAGGLFVPIEGSTTGNFVDLPQQTIDSSGTITVPYVGRIKAAGFSTGAIERAIVEALKNRAIEPQAIVTVEESSGNQVTVIGEVDTSQKIDINQNGERLLDVIARSGGIVVPAEEAYVTLTRGRKKSTVLFKEITENSRENVYIYPGDTVFIDRERRTYVAIGATGSIGRLDFSESNLTLAEAIGEAGGLNDGRADPAKVFVYRLVHRKALLKTGADLSELHQTMVPTVFRINLRDPSAMFRAQKFAMQDKDILYVSNADAIEIFKFLDFVSGVTGGVSTTIGNIKNVKSNWKSLAK